MKTILPLLRGDNETVARQKGIPVIWAGNGPEIQSDF